MTEMRKTIEDIKNEKNISKKLEYIREYLPDIDIRNIPDSMREELGFPKRRNRPVDVTRKIVKRRYQKQFKVELSEIEKIYVEQKGLCAICHRNIVLPYAKDRPDMLVAHVDYDHNTGKIRGLLCPNCNLAVGYINGNLEYARSMGEYLERYWKQDK